MGHTSEAACKCIRPATCSVCIRVVAAPSDQELSRIHRRREASFLLQDSKRSSGRSQDGGEIRDSCRTMQRLQKEVVRPVPAVAAGAIAVRWTQSPATKLR